MRTQPTRPAVTLMEVLVATFILSIGLISVIAMFPIGARNMIEAVKNERTAQAAHNADNMMRVSWKNWHINQSTGEPLSDKDLMTAQRSMYRPFAPASDVFLANLFALDMHREEELLYRGSGNAQVQQAYQEYPIALRDTNNRQAMISDLGPSHPVFVDPIGFTTQSGTNQLYVGGVSPVERFIQRIPHPDGHPTNTTAQHRLRLSCTFDDMSFEESGEPKSPGAQLDRGYRYNYAWLLQRPNNQLKSVVKSWVLAFDGRAYNDVAAQEFVFNLDNTLGAMSYRLDGSNDAIRLNFAALGTRPPLKKGGWIMVATRWPGTQPDQPLRWIVDFIRVTSIDEPVMGQQLSIGLERAMPNAGSIAQKIVIFEHLAEVFDRSLLTLKTGQVW